MKRCSKNIQQNSMRKPMRKCEIALQLYVDQTLTWVFLCKFSAYIQGTFLPEYLLKTAPEIKINN